MFLAALVGAGLGFLWYNAPPAMIFMGDTGSLPLGGALGAVAVAVKHEIVLAIVGGLFVLETVSVIVQVVSFKLTGKRVFRMAPIHHHYRTAGLERAHHRDPLLDRRGGAGAGRPCHLEAAVSAMIAARSFAHQDVAVFGLARTGLGVGALAEGRRRAVSSPGTTTESARDVGAARRAPRSCPGANGPGTSIAALVLSPACRSPIPRRTTSSTKARGVECRVIGDVELFAREIRPDAACRGRAPVIAITGTNGKSTTTALIGHILNSCGFDAQIGGNIGKSVLELVAARREDDLCAGDVQSSRSICRPA